MHRLVIVNHFAKLFKNNNNKIIKRTQITLLPNLDQILTFKLGLDNEVTCIKLVLCATHRLEPRTMPIINAERHTSEAGTH